ncbi:ABC transporter substrate-binding protein [Patescibacteria group bacterium]|nr:ABC transporter substrate-binding protein [Patescibacteria group bacterium]
MQNFLKMFFLIFVLGGIFLFLQDRQYVKNNNNETIKIGHIAILTGPLASVGEAQLHAASLAVEDINSTGGVNGHELELVVEDYGYDTKQALQVYERFDKQGIDYFLADGSSGVAVLREQFVDDHNVNIAAGATTPVYFDGSPFTCRIALTADDYARKIANTLNERSYRTIGLLAAQNEYGEGMLESLNVHLPRVGMSVISAERFNTSDTDFRTHIAKLTHIQDQLDALVVINPTNSVTALFKQVHELGITVPLVSDNWTVLHPSIHSREYFDNVVFVDYEYSVDDTLTNSDKTKAFVERYQDRFGSYPIMLAANTYDSMMLYAQAFNAVGYVDPAKVANYFVNDMQPYQGISGTISFDHDCEVVRNAVVKEITDGVISSVE